MESLWLSVMQTIKLEAGIGLKSWLSTNAPMNQTNKLLTIEYKKFVVYYLVLR